MSRLGWTASGERPLPTAVEPCCVPVSTLPPPHRHPPHRPEPYSPELNLIIIVWRHGTVRSYVEKLRAIPTEGGEFTLKSRVVGVHKRGSGASVEYEAVIVDDDGVEYYRLISGSFLVGAKGFKDAGEICALVLLRAVYAQCLRVVGLSCTARIGGRC